MHEPHMIQTIYTFLCSPKVLKYLEVPKSLSQSHFHYFLTSRTEHFDTVLTLLLAPSSRIHEFRKTSVLRDTFKHKVFIARSACSRTERQQSYLSLQFSSPVRVFSHFLAIYWNINLHSALALISSLRTAVALFHY